MEYTPRNSGKGKPSQGIVGGKPGKPGLKPILKVRVPVKPAPKPGFGINPPKKRGMGR